MFSSIIADINNNNIHYLTKSDKWLEAQIAETARLIDQYVDDYKLLKSAYDIKKELQQMNMLVVSDGNKSEIVSLKEALRIPNSNIPTIIDDGYDVITASVLNNKINE